MHRPSTLLLLVLGLLLVGCTARYATATSLTYKLKPSEKACFYTWVDQAGKKVAFYFAVRTRGRCCCSVVANVVVVVDTDTFVPTGDDDDDVVATDDDVVVDTIAHPAT